MAYVGGVYVYSRFIAVNPTNLATCFNGDEKAPFPAACLRNTVDTVLEKFPASALVEYTIDESSPRSILYSCHGIGHIIGERAYAKSDSLEVALAQCSSSCRAACLHGAIGAAVTAEWGGAYPEEDIAHSGIETLQRIGGPYCTRSSLLCHAIGHLAYIAKGDDPIALSVCNTVGTGLARESCFQGIYMERAGSEEALHATEKAKSFATEGKDYTYPCLSISPPYRHACMHFLLEFQQPLFEQDGIIEPLAKLAKSRSVCESMQQPERAYCFEGIGIQSSRLGFTTDDNANLQSLCDSFSLEEDRDACTIGVIPKFFFMGNIGLNYCAAIAETRRQSLCYDTSFMWWKVIHRGMDGLDLVCTGSCKDEYDAYQKNISTLPDYKFGLYGI